MFAGSSAWALLTLWWGCLVLWWAPCLTGNLIAFAVGGRRRVVACKAVVAEPPSSSKQGPIIMDGQILHSLTPERLALVATMGPFVEAEVSVFAAVSRI